jgi:hypothetical protein
MQTKEQLALSHAERAVIEAAKAWRTAFGLDESEWRCKRDLFAACDRLLALQTKGDGT